jgi:hypothetical protein
MLSKQSLLTPASGPAGILIAEKAAIRKILVDEDFRKAPDYERIRDDPHVASLITETDKVKYKQKVITNTVANSQSLSLLLIRDDIYPPLSQSAT